jgi:hypothetical protein
VSHSPVCDSAPIIIPELGKYRDALVPPKGVWCRGYRIYCISAGLVHVVTSVARVFVSIKDMSAQVTVAVIQRQMCSTEMLGKWKRGL